MDGTELVITVLGLALIIAGVVSFRAWLNQKTEQRKIESDDEDTKLWLENYQAQLEHDTRRFDALVAAMHRQPVLGEVDAAVDVARTKIVKAVGEEHGGKVLGVHLAPEFASEITTQKRQQSTEIRLVGVYRVAKVDTTVPDGFRVTLTDEKTGDEISASLIDALISAEHRDIIQKAEWKKQPIFVEMHARRLRHRIVDAVIVSVHEREPGEARISGGSST
jgi:hypothetical protein